MSSRPRVYYNEWDEFCQAWLRNLMAAGEIPEGEIDGRDIRAVQPDDVRGFDVCHFFAGIGGWALAFRYAGISAPPRRLWSASLPCQPWSTAGQAGGVLDERHLWPAFRRLIPERDPPDIVGEQVASEDGRAWFSGVRLALETLGYSCGAADLCSASIGADHIRQRLYWCGLANAGHDQRGRWDALAGSAESPAGAAHQDGDSREGGRSEGGFRPRHDVADGSAGGGVAYTPSYGRQEYQRRPGSGQEPELAHGFEASDRMDHTISNGRRTRRHDDRQYDGFQPYPEISLVSCADGVHRRFESGSFPLAYGIPQGMGRGEPELAGMVKSARANRVGRLKGYGNAIDPRVAAEFLRAVMDCQP